LTANSGVCTSAPASIGKRRRQHLHLPAASNACSSIDIAGNGTLIETTKGKNISLFADLTKCVTRSRSKWSSTIINAPLGTVTTSPRVDEQKFARAITGSSLALKAHRAAQLDQSRQ
jgi:hypothetical protein